MANQLTLEQRPYAIDPTTKLMILDGIFIKSLNNGQALMRVKFQNPLYVDRPWSPPYLIGLKLSSNTFSIFNLPEPSVFPYNMALILATRPYFYKEFLVNLSETTIGKNDFTIHVKFWSLFAPFGFPEDFQFDYDTATGYSAEFLFAGQIFVADASFDVQTRSAQIDVPQGSITVEWTGVQIFSNRAIKGDLPCGLTQLALPKKYHTKINFTPRYEGLHGPIPFDDPWWKAVALCVAIIAGLIAGVWALGGWIGWWDNPIGHVEQGSADPETGEVCRDCSPPDVGNGYTSVSADPVWGAFLTLAVLAGAVALSDLIDPYRRGEAASPPKDKDLTQAETLDFELDYINLPLPGFPFRIGVDWEFTRHGVNLQDYPKVVQRDDEVNIHYLDQVNVNTIDGNTDYPRSTTRELIITADLTSQAFEARSKKEIADKERAMPPEFYVYGVLRHRASGRTKTAIFRNDGNYPDVSQNDRIFTGTFPIVEVDPLGDYDIMVMVQNVNNAPSEWEAVEKAQVIGGFLYSRNFRIRHDQNTGSCKYEPRWDLAIRLV